jgi:hypothetical protein
MYPVRKLSVVSHDHSMRSFEHWRRHGDDEVVMIGSALVEASPRVVSRRSITALVS